jgi:hypothetical protein
MAPFRLFGGNARRGCPACATSGKAKAKFESELCQRAGQETVRYRT